eukprot:366324-Chlamydomonas_euryale.AAC.9
MCKPTTPHTCVRRPPSQSHTLVPSSAAVPTASPVGSSRWVAGVGKGKERGEFGLGGACGRRWRAWAGSCARGCGWKEVAGLCPPPHSQPP